MPWVNLHITLLYFSIFCYYFNLYGFCIMWSCLFSYMSHLNFLMFELCMCMFVYILLQIHKLQHSLQLFTQPSPVGTATGFLNGTWYTCVKLRAEWRWFSPFNIVHVSLPSLLKWFSYVCTFVCVCVCTHRTSCLFGSIVHCARTSCTFFLYCKFSCL